MTLDHERDGGEGWGADEQYELISASEFSRHNRAPAGTLQELALVKDAIERGVSFGGRAGDSLREEEHNLRQERRQLQRNLWQLREERRLGHQIWRWQPLAYTGGMVVQHNAIRRNSTLDTLVYCDRRRSVFKRGSSRLPSCP